MQFKWLRILSLIVLCHWQTFSWGSTTNKLWSLLTLTGNYGTFLYYLEPQLRLIQTNRMFNQFLTNAGGGYQVAPAWQLWFGQTITTTSQDADPGNFEEYRVWEQIVWQHSINTVRLTSRTRLEQRKSFDFAEWANRVRERMLVNIPITTNISLAMSDEILVNLNRVQWISTKTWDQNRAYIGLVRQFTKSTSLSAGYMHQWIFTAPKQSDNVLFINFMINLET